MESEIINVICPDNHSNQKSNVVIEDCTEIQDDIDESSIIMTSPDSNEKTEYVTEEFYENIEGNPTQTPNSSEDNNFDSRVENSHVQSNLVSLMENENQDEELMENEQAIENDESNEENEMIENNESENKTSKRKRGIPKTLLANQRKYLEALEKQQKMLNSRKDKKKTQPVKKGKSPVKQVESVNSNKIGTRRVIVAGKVKYLPINNEKSEKTDTSSVDIPIEETIEMPIVKRETKTKPSANNLLIAPTKIIKSISKTSRSTVNDIDQTSEPEKPKRVPSAIAKKMEIHKAVVAKQNIMIKRKPNSTSSNKKIPSKYAKQIENDVKKQTIKNVKNFSDLRRVKAMQEINPDSDIDASKASIIELRKLKIEQRKKEQSEMKKRAEANKRESKIQEILRNDKMSKFSKTLAIKNLSVTSRNGRLASRNKMSENRPM